MTVRSWLLPHYYRKLGFQNICRNWMIILIFPPYPSEESVNNLTNLLIKISINWSNITSLHTFLSVLYSRIFFLAANLNVFAAEIHVVLFFSRNPEHRFFFLASWQSNGKQFLLSWGLVWHPPLIFSSLVKTRIAPNQIFLTFRFIYFFPHVL